jgi:pimeloyl-ACP methyl ester carboxylesterase
VSPPALTTLSPRGAVRAVALIAHGGSESSVRPATTLDPAALRMYPFLLDLHRAGRRRGLVTCQLRYRVRGYNEGDPVDDVEWALEEIARRHGDAPVCLLGHSMGARAALRAAAAAHVRGVVALAPWLPQGEPVEQLAGRTIVIAHGTRDRVTAPAASLAYALRAVGTAERLCRFEVRGSRHGMLDRAPAWHALARRAVLACAGLIGVDGELERAFALPAEAACRVPI